MSSSQIPPLSACVTRILSLSGFPPQLKTRDIQAAFSEWESERGGFKIKWVDDTGLLLVFADAATAKRAYLQTLYSPPAAIVSPTGVTTACIRPYDGPDAQTIINTVNSRRSNNNSRTSMSMPQGQNPAQAFGRPPFADGHRRGESHGGSLGRGSWKNGNGHASSASVSILNTNSVFNPNGREPSPTLPSLPSHPTLNALITSTLSDMTPPENGMDNGSGGLPPKVGDPARRMVGAALGIRHPSISPSKSQDLQKAMNGMTIAE